MSLKLFRSTGYSSILTAGETRLAMHPGWMIFWTSLWVGFACNTVLWQQIRSPGSTSLAQATGFGIFAAGACGLVLSVLGWRKTLKPAAMAMLFLAALGVCAVWSRSAPSAASLAGVSLWDPALPSWQGLLRWQAWATLAGLALLPAWWVCRTRVRRLPGQQQLGVNVTGMVMAGTVVGLSAFIAA